MSRTTRLTILSAWIALLLFAACMGNPHFIGGKNYVKQEVWDKAVAEFEIALEQQPKNAEAWYYYGWAQCETGDFEKGGEALRRSTELSDAFARDVEQKLTFFWEDLAARGQDLERGGDYEGAAAKFEAALHLRPDHVDSYTFLAQVYGQMGKVEAARAKFDQAIELRPDNDTTLTNYAVFLQANGLDREAIPLYQKLSELHPDETNYQREMARIYMAAGMEEEALGIYRELGEAATVMNLAYAAMEEEDYAGAFRYYEMARQVAAAGSDEYWDACYNAIVAAFKMEDFGKARVLGEKLVKEAPGDARNWRILASVYRQLKMPEEALDAFGKVERLEGGGR